MSKPKLETFGLTAIQTVLTNAADLQTARHSLVFAVGATVGVSGVVVKRVRRDELCKLVIKPDSVQLSVFADCKADENAVISRKIRKGSRVSVRGKLQSFGSQSVCLADCRLR
jgi:primosomal replication protein N